MIFKDVKSHDVMMLLHYETWGVKGQMRGINCQACCNREKAYSFFTKAAWPSGRG